MCGIFGSFDREEFRSLLHMNQERGSSSIGLCRVVQNKHVHFIEKYPLISFNEEDWFERDEEIHKHFDYKTYYLGHIQAPTEGQEHVEEESHPFELNNLIWAHNGIIQNHKKLREDFLLPEKPVTDSFVIGGMLIHLVMDWTILQELDGIFACWVVNKLTKDIFIFRATSSLYMSDTSFSSLHFNSAKEVPQGYVFKLKEKGFEQIEIFNIKNMPFYIPE